MGLSYTGGDIDSDSARDVIWDRTIDPFLKSLEEGALGDDLTLRLGYSDEPGAGKEFLIETRGEGRLRALLTPNACERVIDWVETVGSGDALAEDILVRAAQYSFGRTWMLCARYRRVVREAYRCMIWHLHQPLLAGNMHREPLDLDGRGTTVSIAELATSEEARGSFIEWVNAAMAEEDPESFAGRISGKEPRFVYSMVRSKINVVRRAEKWLRDASALCEATAPQVPRTERGFLEIAGDPDAGMVNLDTGETHPKGFPVFRAAGHGIDVIELALPTLDPDRTFNVVELDLAASEDHLEFEARSPEYAWQYPDGPPPLRALLMRSLGDHQPALYENWLRMGASILEEPEPFVIEALADLDSRPRGRPKKAATA